MVGQSRKWMILVATTWIQAFTGTNFDFSSYSSTLKSVLGISQVQLNYLSVASDMGKVFGWCSGVSLMYFPLWVVMFMAAFFGLFGYGVQWLVIKQIITLPYFPVFLLCLVAGCSICWFNTVCFVLCIRNFPTNRALALSLTISFNGVTAALYTLIANAINHDDDTLYLFLNALVPLLASILALVPILRQPPLQLLSTDVVSQDSFIFIVLNVLAVITGLYLLLLNSLSSEALRARILLVGALMLLLLPLCLPGIVCGRNWARRTIHSRFCLDVSNFRLVDPDDLELHKELIGNNQNNGSSVNPFYETNKEGFFGKVMEKGRLTMLGEEHSARLLVRRWDFWLYYVAYFCGGTIGLVYSNNIGQIAQSLGYYSQISTVVTLYSSFSFFGRLLSAAPDFLRDKVYYARTGWLAVALVPTPIAFFLLAASGSEAALHAGTAMIGLSSGFVFSAAVSITSELFGPNSASVNHNILITNIPIGSLLYGLLAALVYDSNVKSSMQENSLEEAMVCMGRDCYLQTFICWGCISMLGLISSFLLFLRTRPAYDDYERNRSPAQFS
ncbi:protein NUCLEAR FUSION DEFECTIVE 4-like [Durio zibethinus]|uniref:Protein NUCLEAR FUSION DEFECTIVE 4-like n=1 Tax=Durio zibethinus TaxID=66656 RepID=A0A6P5WT38_DURZI|nr:protein NUCLEAR FUSION DEFECTIVE 4-like [Durio zibethinus]